MTQNRSVLVCGAMLVLVSFLSPAFGQNDIESPQYYSGVWYRLLVDGDGNLVEGEGDGEGWYYYPASDTWRMWFYNSSYDPARQASLEYHVYTKAIDPTTPTYMTAYYGWTTPEWSSRGLGRPPLPSDMGSASLESQYMTGARIYAVDSVVTTSVETNRKHTVEDYNPEWICIGLKVRNAYVYRGVFHECTSGTSHNDDDDDPRTERFTADFGDAPDSGYLTLLASNGARHTIVPGVCLGSGIDGESDGQPNTAATGDDNSDDDDEDGVTFTTTLQAGQDASLLVVASTSGYLNAWIDFDGDAKFDNDDRIFSDRVLKSGTNVLTVTVPKDAVPGYTYARFRFNTRGSLGSYGPADDGEVEDYRVQIVATSKTSEAVSGVSSLVWSQPPSLVTDSNASVFDGGSVSSSLHLYEMAADDWEPVHDQAITGVHWWGVFDGWTESYPPSDLPVAFHIGIWTGSSDSSTFAHPDRMIWGTYCTNWAWAVAGTEGSDDANDSGQTCFLFSYLLSQDQWIEIDQTKDDSGSKVYWLSIAALYDVTDYEPKNLWSWKLRTTATGAAGTSVRTILSSSGMSFWPPVVGCQWETGSPLTDSRFNDLDMAFQLTTFAPLER